MPNNSIKNNAGLDVDDIPEAEVISSPDRQAELDENYKGKIKVINMLTGEVMEREYQSVTEMVDLYNEINGTKQAAERALKKLMSQIQMFMATRDNYDLPNGSRLKWISPERRVYVFERLASKIDADALAVVADVPKGKIENLLNEMVESGELSRDEQYAIMQECTEVQPGTPYLKITN
jgi:hypothetical protein